LEIEPRLIMAYHNRAQAYRRQGKLDLAEADCEAILSAEPRSYVGYLGLAVIRFHQGRLPEAKHLLDLAIKFEPHSSAAFVERGRVKNRESDLNGAISDWEEAIRLRPRPDSDIWELLGHAYDHAGRLLEAERMFTVAIGRRPDQWEFRRDRARLREKMEDWNGSLSDYQDLHRCGAQSSSRPALTEAYLGMVRSHLMLAQTADALRVAESALSETPVIREAYLSRAAALLALERFSDAIDDANIYLRHFPQDPYAYWTRGIARYHLEEWGGALSDLEEVIRLRPANQKMRYQAREHVDIIHNRK